MKQDNKKILTFRNPHKSTPSSKEFKFSKTKVENNEN